MAQNVLYKQAVRGEGSDAAGMSLGTSGLEIQILQIQAYKTFALHLVAVHYDS